MSRAPYVNNLHLIHQGKVRDTYETNVPGMALMVATDAISTHNVVHLSTVPRKGQILTALSVFWANEVLGDISTHIIAHGKRIYDYLPHDRQYPDDLHLRSIVVELLEMAPYEFIFRARMAGSLWNKYYSKGLENPYGLDLPEGLMLMSPFREPIFTPTEKSATDDPVNSVAVEAMYPGHVDLAREVYKRGRTFALSCGVDIIDFKAEVGVDGVGKVQLGDEWLNGDCCRFVRAGDIEIGHEPPWADKEIFRQNAVEQWGGPKGPSLIFPESVIQEGIRAYLEIFRMLTNYSLEHYQETF